LPISDCQKRYSEEIVELLSPYVLRLQIRSKKKSDDKRGGMQVPLGASFFLNKSEK
jgi:hypothetical protein